MKVAYLSIGSNLGNRTGYIREALGLLRAEENIRLTRVSSGYETEPVGFTDQEKFINGAVSLETSHGPHALLRILQGIENRLERKRTLRWGPRTVDLDILFFGDVVLDDPVLTIPHPRLTERAFVLFPLSEIAPAQVHPLTGKTVLQHLEALEDKGGVEKLEGESLFVLE